MGIYVIARNIKAKYLNSVGKMSLYIMEFHSLIISFAGLFVLYIFDTIVFSSEFINKLVDCLEKCLIYGHIRRVAD